jgi:hypothetical protein
VLDGVAALPIYPTRGVVPGCPGACTWAKLALVECMDTVLEKHCALSALRLNIHVDDIAVALSFRQPDVTT